jgi:hypothetical protein
VDNRVIGYVVYVLGKVLIVPALIAGTAVVGHDGVIICEGGERRCVEPSLLLYMSDQPGGTQGPCTLPWSNGPSEGLVNRIKLVKRPMYGGGSFDLLCMRVLLTLASRLIKDEPKR